MLTNRDKQAFAQTFKRFQSDLIAPAHEGTFSLTAMVANLQSKDPKRNAQTKTETIATLNQVADVLQLLSECNSMGGSAERISALQLLGGVVALCADVINADSFAGYGNDGGGNETR